MTKKDDVSIDTVTNLALDLAKEMNSIISKRVEHLDVSESAKYSIAPMVHAMAFVIEVNKQFLSCHEHIKFEDFKKHCMECIDISFIALKIKKEAH